MERVAASSQAVCCTLQPLNARLSTLRIALTPGQRFRFGRHAECEQSFPSDYRISSLHASLLLDVWDDGTPCIAIEDSSINGTYINAERVPKGARLRLRSGDQLFLVIPSEELLHATGYEGSLVAKFIGYVFSYDSDVTPAAAPVGRLSGRFVPASEKSAPEDAMGETDPCSSQAASSGTPSSIAQMTAAARAAAATAAEPPPPMDRLRRVAAELHEERDAAAGSGEPPPPTGAAGELPPAVSMATWLANLRSVESARPPWSVASEDLQVRRVPRAPSGQVPSGS